MSDSQPVDLLLVRLSREEEKEKVLEMLISELGMSHDEAREKVDSSPNILSEGISMEQARILQNRMYPYIDLLPRSYSTITQENVVSSDVNQENISSESLQSDETDIDIQIEYPEEETLNSEDEEKLVITTAADEVLSIDRCHICGRTPTSSQKLAPCRTCGELTCSDCFNRKMHVCEKCVSEGRAVDRPLDNKPERKKDRKHEITSDDRKKTISENQNIFSKLSPAVITITAAVLILIAFFLIDPINLFSNNMNGSGMGSYISSEDSVVSAVLPESDSVPDTILTEMHTDTLISHEDSLTAQPDTSRTLISLRNIRIPEFPETPDEIVLPRLLLSTPVRGIQVYRDSLTLLSYPVGYIATSISVKIDAISLIHTSDGYTLFIMSILHPEPVEKRTALISSIGELLDSTVVDQMVLYYRENDYYDSDLFSFVSDSFSVISQSNSPYFLQRKQATIPEIRTLVFENINDWITNLD
ncbi:MAG: hypothetical protein K8R76_07335 [Candidatus Aegiribacteria sp.]|nr:hypothetical protein [Candidatus Aegiribacteria sp.]